MSTAKPRITITLEPRVYEVVSRLSRVNGQPMSQIVAGFLDVAVPPMERMVVLLEQANAAPKEARSDVASSFARAESRILPALMNAITQTDMFLVQEMEGVAAAVRGSGAPANAAVDALPTPGPVTRGSGRRKARSGGHAGGAE